MIKNLGTEKDCIKEQDSNAHRESLEYLPLENKPKRGERLARNIALAGMLVLTVSAVRNARLPDGKTVLAAVQALIDTKWDDRLGKISFVSNLLPETVSVFFDTNLQTGFISPCLGSVSHAWSESEPYIGYHAKDSRIYAAAAGQVMSIAHGPDEEMIVRIRHENGMETMYYNLSAVSVAEGDTVTEQTCLGAVIKGKEAAVEVRRAGIAIDPTGLISDRQTGEKK